MVAVPLTGLRMSDGVDQADVAARQRAELRKQISDGLIAGLARTQELKQKYQVDERFSGFVEQAKAVNEKHQVIQKV